MRTGHWLLLPCAISLATIFGLACTAQQAAPGALSGGGGDDDDTPAKKTTSKTSSTCLGKVGLAYDNAACNTCMSADGCCQKTIACFTNNAECSALQDCMAACGGGGTTGPGTPTTTDAGTGGTTNNAAKASFTANVYPSIVGTCGSCHQAGGTGSPTFLTGSADSTYTYFKSAGWTTNQSPFYTHGAHTGPALTPDQKTKIDAWIALEATTPASGNGSGTGNGTGGGGGGGGGNGAGGTAACQATCKTQHAAAVTAWTDFNVCVTQTCGSSCL